MSGTCLCFGLNGVLPSSYGGWNGRLLGCEKDVDHIATLAHAQGFHIVGLKTSQAKEKWVDLELRRAAKTLRAGDRFVLFGSEHGSQWPDDSGDEPDKKDEVHCLYDTAVTDDWFASRLALFGEEVEIFALWDKCHAESSVKGTREDRKVRVKSMPAHVAQEVFSKRPPLKDAIKSGSRAGVIEIGACQSDQYSYDSGRGGWFTNSFIYLWNIQGLRLPFPQFHARLVDYWKPPRVRNMVPSYFEAGRVTNSQRGHVPFTL